MKVERDEATLRPITNDDLPLYEELLVDPATMAELGGPISRDGLAEKLRGIVEDVEARRTWYFVILPDDEAEPAGTVCVWSHDWNGQEISEIGWMVLPRFQGRGLATRAVRTVLRRAGGEARWDVIHAFPAVTNAPSNAICRKTGFSLVGQADIDYAGRVLRCNHWRVDVRPTAG
ncbi:MAG TPA: GNAT family N-acetyltransferase [Actinomycetota bacterium]|nr:GNAT family N-acetyltransferase [Actinomycetota bacterium]